MIRKQEINYGMRSETIKLKISRIIAFDVWHKKKWGAFLPTRDSMTLFSIGWTLFFLPTAFYYVVRTRTHDSFDADNRNDSKSRSSKFIISNQNDRFLQQAGAKKVLHDVNATFYDKNNVNAHKRIDFVERLSISFYEDATFCSTFGWEFADFLLWIFSRILWNARARFFLAASTKFDLQ